MTNSQRTTPNPTFAHWLESHLVPAGYANPADRLVRTVFGEPENAASYLRATLAPELTAQLDLTELAPVPASLIDRNDRRDHTDVLFTVPYVPFGHEHAFVHLVYGQRGSRHASEVCARAQRSFAGSYAEFIKAHAQPGRTPELPQLIGVGIVTGGARST